MNKLNKILKPKTRQEIFNNIEKLSNIEKFEVLLKIKYKKYNSLNHEKIQELFYEFKNKLCINIVSTKERELINDRRLMEVEIQAYDYYNNNFIIMRINSLFIQTVHKSI